MNNWFIRRANIVSGGSSPTPPGPTPRLPDGYTEVAYIQTSGTQYINTSIKPTVAKQTEVTVDFERVSSVSGNQGFGANGNLSIMVSSGKWRIAGVTLDTVVDGERLTLILKQTSDGRYYSLGSNSGYGSSGESANNFCLGVFGGATSYKVAAKYYECIIKEEGVKVRHLIPCLRDSDTKPGMYDLVSDSFFNNKGSGEFSYGTL